MRNLFDERSSRLRFAFGVAGGCEFVFRWTQISVFAWVIDSKIDMSRRCSRRWTTRWGTQMEWWRNTLTRRQIQFSENTNWDASSHSFIWCSEGTMTAVDIMSLLVYKNALMLILASSMCCWQTVAASSHCQPSESALRSWSIWAMRANHSHHSHHLSLISPTLTQTYLLPVSHTDLHTNPLLAGDDQCPSSLNQLQGEPLMHRSLCPWYWRINYDPLRYVRDSSSWDSVPGFRQHYPKLIVDVNVQWRAIDYSRVIHWRYEYA